MITSRNWSSGSEFHPGAVVGKQRLVVTSYSGHALTPTYRPFVSVPPKRHAKDKRLKPRKDNSMSTLEARKGQASC